MIDKIKAEIEKNNEIEWMGDTTQRQIYEKCLKWAEEVYNTLYNEWKENGQLDIQQFREAFHGGGK